MYWARLATAGALAVSLGAGLAAYALGNVSPTFLRATALAGILGVAAGMLNLSAPQKGAAESERHHTMAIWGWCVAGFVAFDVVLAGWGLNPGIDPAFYSRIPNSTQAVEQALAGGRIYLAPQDEYRLKFDDFMRFDSFEPRQPWDEMRETLLPNLNLINHLPTASNYDPLVPGRYARWMDALEGLDGDRQKEMLNLMNASVVENISSTGEVGILYNKRTGAKRLRWVTCAMAARDGEDAWNLVTAASLDFDQTVVLEGVEDLAAYECSAGFPPVAIELGLDDPGHVVAMLNPGSNGWLVLSDMWYPGWQARIDGQVAVIERANYLFRAVAVPAGEHRVEFIYRPVSFWAGIFIGTISWLTIFVAWIILKKRGSIGQPSQ